jgi:hypothetical protein
MYSAERGSGVQEQLFRGLLLLRAAIDQKCKSLETGRKRVNGGITDKKPNASATSVPLRFKGFHPIQETVAAAEC